jgi:hypothetical protein
MAGNAEEQGRMNAAGEKAGPDQPMIRIIKVEFQGVISL